MTKFSPELEAGARAMYQYLSNCDGLEEPLPWDSLPQEYRDDYFHSFSAGLEAMLPPTGPTVGAMWQELDTHEPTDVQMHTIFTAAIRHITKRDA